MRSLSPGSSPRLCGTALARHLSPTLRSNQDLLWTVPSGLEHSHIVSASCAEVPWCDQCYSLPGAPLEVGVTVTRLRGVFLVCTSCSSPLQHYGPIRATSVRCSPGLVLSRVDSTVGITVPWYLQLSLTALWSNQDLVAASGGGLDTCACSEVHIPWAAVALPAAALALHVRRCF